LYKAHPLNKKKEEEKINEQGAPGLQQQSINNLTVID
jgi:hypothetical protein